MDAGRANEATSIESDANLRLAAAVRTLLNGNNVRILLITGALLGAIVGGGAQLAFCSEDQSIIVGRWELTSIDLPVALQRREYVIIESTTIKIKRDCNQVTLSYSVKGDELRSTPVTTTLKSCHLPKRFADENRLVYDALLHSRYQLDGDVLRLFSLSDAAFDYSLEFHRVQ